MTAKDLTEITTPFGLLDEETQRRLRAEHRDDKQIQVYAFDGEWKWCNPDWTRSCVYRVAPTEPHKRVVVVDVVKGSTRYIFPHPETNLPSPFYSRESIPGYAGVRWEGMDEFTVRIPGWVNRLGCEDKYWLSPRPLQIAFVIEEK